MVSVALVSGCSTASINDVSYPVQREENVLNRILSKPFVEVQSTTEIKTQGPLVEATASPQPQAEESSQPKPQASSKPALVSEPEPSPTASSSSSGAIEEALPVYDTAYFVDNAELCKIPELFLENDPPMPSKGFPLARNKVPYLGQVNIDVIFIDFSNATSNNAPSPDSYEQVMKSAVEWSKFYSGGKMVYNIRMHKEWLRAPKEAQEYPIRSNREEFAKPQDWIDVADPYYDFSDTHFVFFIVPEKAHVEFGADMYGPSRSFTDEGLLEVPVWTSEFAPELSWQHLVHEILHDQGIGGHGPANGSSYGIMMGQWYGSYSIISWNTFLMGWTRDEDIVCIDARDGFKDVAIRLQSLDKLGASAGIKSIIIRKSNTAATIIEYRTNGRFSPISESLHGVTVYNLDVAKKWHRCDSCGPQQYQDEKNWWNYIRKPNSFDARSNNNINFGNGIIPNTDGLTIEVRDKNLILISQ